MKTNKWTLALAAMGVITLPMASQAEEKLSPVQTALASTVISGYVNVAAQWNPGTGNANPPAFVFNDRSKQDAFSLNAAKLSIAKPLDEGKWAAGYKLDLMFGPDADTLGTQSLGVKGDFAVRQAYVSLGTPVGNGLNFDMGVFDTILGYEVTDAGSNPNYTRSYGYTIEPVSHLGILGSYKFCDFFSAKAGVANTHGPRINDNANNESDVDGNPNTKAESFKAYMGLLTLTAPKEWGFLEGSTLSGGVVNGFNNTGGNAATGENQTSWYLGTTLATPVKALKVGASFDYAQVHDGGDAWVLGGYASFQLTEKLTLFGRGEYLSRSDTFNGYGAGPVAGVPYGLPTKVVETTVTAQYDLWKNVLTRLEFRWDHSADGTEAYGGTAPGVPDLMNSFLLAANIIYNF